MLTRYDVVVFAELEVNKQAELKMPTYFYLLALVTSTLGQWSGNNDVDRPYGDLPGMPITMDNDGQPSDCAKMCATHEAAQCKAWVYVKPFCDGQSRPLCYLKAQLMPQEYKQCRVRFIGLSQHNS